MTISNFTDARRALSKFIPKDASVNQPYTLDTMLKLMDYLDNPQNKLRIVHVAGTSGKTSTAYYVAALLAETGSRVGLTVSPHVDEVNERLQLNMIPLVEKEYCAELSEFIKIVEKSSINPSYFEILIAFAYWEFAKQQVDYAIIEVGLGGLLDGTNVVDRTDKVCVITDIGLDHVRVLGNTLTAIARQKAGIITKNNITFSFRQGNGVSDVISEVAQRQEAKLILLEPDEQVQSTEFLPTFQQRNFALAHKAVDYIIDRDNLPHLSDAQVLTASRTHIPGRMEIFHKNNKTIIVDGAHNAQKINALARAIAVQFPNQPVAVLVSFVAGGEDRLETALQELASLSKHIILTTFRGEQDTPKHSIDPAEIMAAAKGLDLDLSVIEKPEMALESLLDQAEPLLVVTGSFYLLNHIRPLMLKS